MNVNHQDHSQLPCFRCGKTIELEGFTQGLRDAISFISYGGYGSTVYDPFGTDRCSYRLRIHICDECVRWGAGQGIILEATIIKQPDKVTYEKFDIDRDRASQ